MHITAQSASGISLSFDFAIPKAAPRPVLPQNGMKEGKKKKTGGIAKEEWNNFPFAPSGTVAFNWLLLDVSIWPCVCVSVRGLV